MRIIRASEVGTYLYCARAWWYQQQGVRSSHQVKMNAGSELHRHHGRQVRTFIVLRIMAMILLILALVLLISYFIGRLK